MCLCTMRESCYECSNYDYNAPVQKKVEELPQFEFGQKIFVLKSGYQKAFPALFCGFDYYGSEVTIKHLPEVRMRAHVEKLDIKWDNKIFGTEAEANSHILDKQIKETEKDIARLNSSIASEKQELTEAEAFLVTLKEEKAKG